MASSLKKILLIEDSMTDSFLTQRLMREYPAFASHTLVVADTMQSAKEYLEHNSDGISLILLDLGLPDTLDYRDCFEQLSEVNKSHIPVIALTSVDSKEISSELARMGLEDFLCKTDVLYSPLLLSQAIDFVLSPALSKGRSLRHMADEYSSLIH